MNFVKVTYPTNQFTSVAPILGVYAVRVCATEEDGVTTAIETLVENEPTEDDIRNIEAQAQEWSVSINKTAAAYTMNREIDELKENLTETDYQALKYAEGYISEEDYASMKAQRQEWRDQINQLEVAIANL